MKPISALSLAAAASLLTLVSSPRPQGQLAPAGELPIGSIVAFWGLEADLPEGWEACDGQAVQTRDAVLRGPKPNLRERFLRGTSTSRTYRPRSYPNSGPVPPSAALRQTDPHVLTVAQLPSHGHPTGSHSHAIPPASLAHTHATPDHQHRVLDHAHGLPGQAVTVTEGTASTISNLHQTTGSGSLATDDAMGVLTDVGGAGTTQGTTFTSTPATSGGSGGSGNTGGGQGHTHDLSKVKALPPYFDIIWIIRVV